MTGVIRQLGARMVVLGGVADGESASAMVDDALGSGRALARLAEMIERQGGNPRVVDDYHLLPMAPSRAAWKAPRSGYVSSLRAHAIGMASNVLGAGRARVGDTVDHAVGVVTLIEVGDRVQAGDDLLQLHHRNGRGLEEAQRFCAAAVQISDSPPMRRAHVLDEVRALSAPGPASADALPRQAHQ